MNQLRIVAENPANNPSLASFIEQYNIPQEDEACDIKLLGNEQGIEVYEYIETEKKPRKHYIEIEKLIKKQRSFPAAKQGAFNQALGKSKTVIDATGGWGGDTLLMCTQGYQVTILERQPMMAILLEDAMQRLSRTTWAKQNNVTIPSVININAIDYFLGNSVKADCIYLDPMFPPKRKQSALANKGMQLLHRLVGEDQDANQLLAAAKKTQTKRIVVKRPDYADSLGSKPDQQFSGKLLHYDVYF